MGFSLGKIAGIDLIVDESILLPIAFIAIPDLGTLDISSFGTSLMYAALAFFTVLLHELGHSLTAQRFGVYVPRIVLSAIGGTAYFDDRHLSRIRRAIIISAGPLTNFAIAAALLWFCDINEDGIVWNWFWINIVLFAFNILPVFPMDGGRLLHIAATAIFGEGTGDAIAMVSGQALAVVMGAFAIWLGLPMMALIAAYLFVMAAKEFGRSPLWFAGR